MKNLSLALLGAFFLASAAQAAPRCKVQDGGWLTGDKKAKAAASPAQCELRNAVYAFGKAKFGVSNTDPEIMSASRKGYAAGGTRANMTANPYAKEVTAFLTAVKKDAGKAKAKAKRQYDIAQLTAGFKSLIEYRKVPEDVQFRFENGRPVLHSPHRTRYKLSSIEEVKGGARQCYMGIDVTGLALGGQLDDCSAKAAPAPAPAKAAKGSRKVSGKGKAAAAPVIAAKAKDCDPTSIQESAQTGASCG